MALVTTKEMLLRAQKGGYAVGAFNVENMEMVQAVLEAASRLQAPVILQTTPSTLKYASPKMFAEMVAAQVESRNVEAAVHLDHGNSFDLEMQCIRAGYTSLMIDGSKLPFEENAGLAKQVVLAAHPNGLPVEAELGKVGGKEDSLVSEGDAMTDPDDAVRFVKLTGIDSLAVAIGTAHGVYKTKPKLDVDRLAEIRKVVSIPLVLHGASGLSDEDVRACIERGICKVNFATELRIAYSEAVKTYIRQQPDVFDPKKYGALAREAVVQQVITRMTVCGANQKSVLC
jgi:tagatose 1,6-diphosphate aldolase GatY/KbaY